MDYLKIRELYHSGVKGMKWGIRRFQNEDGTLTAEGKQRYEQNSNNTLSPYGQKLLKRDIGLEKYRNKLLSPRDKKIAKLEAKQKENSQALNDKIKKAKNEGNTEQANKLQMKKSISDAKHQYALGLKYMERDAIRNMSFDELKTRRSKAKLVLASEIVSTVFGDGKDNRLEKERQQMKKELRSFDLDKDEIKRRKNDLKNEITNIKSKYRK